MEAFIRCGFGLYSRGLKIVKDPKRNHIAFSISRGAGRIFQRGAGGSRFKTRDFLAFISSRTLYIGHIPGDIYK